MSPHPRISSSLCTSIDRVLYLLWRSDDSGALISTYRMLDDFVKCAFWQLRREIDMRRYFIVAAATFTAFLPLSKSRLSPELPSKMTTSSPCRKTSSPTPPQAPRNHQHLHVTHHLCRPVAITSADPSPVPLLISPVNNPTGL